MSLYAIKNDEGKYWNDVAGTWTDSVSDAWELEDAAKEVAGQRNHVVQLVEKSTPIAVSQEEAEMLSSIKKSAAWPATTISDYVDDKYRTGEGRIVEYRLTRAYVSGWTVKKPKRYILPMPDGTANETSANIHVAIHEGFGPWHSSQGRHDITDSNGIHAFTVTQANIDSAPDWVKMLKPVEVRDERD